LLKTVYFDYRKHIESQNFVEKYRVSIGNVEEKVNKQGKYLKPYKNLELIPGHFSKDFDIFGKHSGFFKHLGTGL